MTITEQIIALFESLNWTDHWKRSALGIADSYARGSNIHLGPENLKVDENGLPKDRDSLALLIIELIVDLDKEESYKVRHEARDWLDAPYRNDPALLAWRARRAAQGPLGMKEEG